MQVIISVSITGGIYPDRAAKQQTPVMQVIISISLRSFLYPERETTVRISLSRREGDGFRGRSDGGLPKFGTSPSKEAVFDGDRSFRGTSPSLGAMETLSTAPLRRSAMCCPPLRSFAVRRLSAVPLRRGAALPSSAVRGYFPARCFSQAQAAARVSSTLRSAFQPISRFARDGSAQMAVTSPARRGAKR